MKHWKSPPQAKVYEALTAVADRRVRLTGDNAAEVVSSSGSKTYTIEWEPDFSMITSNDNASFWQGYLGYPIIAVLMEVGKLAYDASVASMLAGIHWKLINDEYKRDYDAVIRSVLEQINNAGGDSQLVVDEVERIFERLQQQSYGMKRSTRRPPK
jgi:hypothetical protein